MFAKGLQEKILFGCHVSQIEQLLEVWFVSIYVYMYMYRKLDMTLSKPIARFASML